MEIDSQLVEIDSQLLKSHLRICVCHEFIPLVPLQRKRTPVRGFAFIMMSIPNSFPTS